MVSQPNKPSSEAFLLGIFDELRRRGLHVPGLFRHPISVTDTRKLYQSVCSDGLGKLKEQEDSYQIAALLLWHLRHLNDPLIPASMYDMVIEIGRSVDDSGENMWNSQEGTSSWMMGNSDEHIGLESGVIELDRLRHFVSKLPRENWHILSILLDFINQVESESGGNEETLSAHSQVFAPVLCRPPGSAYMSLRHVKDLVQIQRVVYCLMANYSLLIKKDSLASRSTDRPVNTPLRDRESEKVQKQKKKAAADLMIVQRLIFDTVSLFFNASPEVEEKKMESSSADILQTGPDKPSNMFLRFPSSIYGSGSSNRRTSFFVESDDEDTTVPLTFGESTHQLSPSVGSSGPKTISMVGRDRRRMQLAAKALRSQITQFEEMFATENGHLPRGRERAALSSTYTQLRQWKKILHIEAIIQIQAFFRGSRVRKRYPNVPRLLQQYIPRQIKNPGDTAQKAEESKTGPPAPSVQGLGNIAELEQHLAMLVKQKKQIKNRLKEYDMKFMEKEGRMPSKSDKEPMRAVYDQYNQLKNSIKEVEESIANNTAAQSKVMQNKAKLTPKNPALEATSTSFARPFRAPNEPIVPVRKPDLVNPLTDASDKFVETPASIEQLKRDKKELHVLLKAYEQEFKDKYGREVSSPSDIAPVEAEYQRYKDIKKRLARV